MFSNFRAHRNHRAACVTCRLLVLNAEMGAEEARPRTQGHQPVSRAGVRVSGLSHEAVFDCRAVSVSCGRCLA